VTAGIPLLGTLTVCLILVAAAYSMAMSIYSARAGVRWLHASRYGAYTTCALVAFAVGLLAYAFLTHDFRIRYVARYSDRSMPWWYLITSLWGGQDGSLLWWTFLLAGYTTACIAWLRLRYLELQPYIIATLMSIIIFFCILMLFAANPFSVTLSSIPPDGEGLNPLLQNYWMTIHPPSLYMGFVGWSIPFAFVIAALITGRLHEEWIYASRRWVLVAWLFLSVGNLLGALWSYEELGWGGYWAWDPVENAAFIPWLSGTAFLHSVMIQERRVMMRVWNVFLMCLTFILTIFGTFLTRSGLIASVHSFARSEIGIYFIGYLVILVLTCFGLIFWRLPRLRATHSIDSYLSREFAFLTNNWILIGMQLFVLIATTFPLISEALRGETVTVGPGYYNKWMVPLGLVLLLLTGIGPLIAWRKATGKNLLRAFIRPGLAALLVVLVHIIVGPKLGFPPMISTNAIYDTVTGRVLAAIYRVMPAASFMLCAFVLAAVAQEFWRGCVMRMKSTGENVLTALVRLVSKAKRRYGGYVVHLGIVSMFVGFTGAAYDMEKEGALRPGQSLDVRGYNIRYERARMAVDPNKRMIFTDMTLQRGKKVVSRISPAKFIYKTHPQMPTTEVAIHSTLANDVYVIMNSVNPQTKVGTFKVIVRPLVMWIWIGGLLLILGVVIAISPTVKEILERMPGATGAAALILCGALLLPITATAQSSDSSSLHAGHVELRSKEERQLFESVLCQCGSCARLPLSTCACGWADDMRKELRSALTAGATIAAIQADYRARFGAKALAIPGDRGLDRALWAVPIVAIMLAALGLVVLARRWMKRGAAVAQTSEPLTQDAVAKYDDLLETELRNLEDR